MKLPLPHISIPPIIFKKRLCFIVYMLAFYHLMMLTTVFMSKLKKKMGNSITWFIFTYKVIKIAIHEIGNIDIPK